VPDRHRRLISAPAAVILVTLPWNHYWSSHGIDLPLYSRPYSDRSLAEKYQMDGFPLQGYDVFMLAVLFLSTAFGAWKGMAWQVAALASLVVSALVAVHGSEPLAPYFSVQAPWNRFLAMLVLYLLTSLAIWMLFRLAAGAIDRVRLKEFDHQIGALFGLAKGVLWCVVITFFAVTLSESARQSILKSRSGYYIAVLINRANPVLPQEIRDVLGEYIEELDRKLDPNTPPATQTLVDHPSVDDLHRGIDGVQRRIDDTLQDIDNLKEGVDFSEDQEGFDRFRRGIDGFIQGRGGTEDQPTESQDE